VRYDVIAEVCDAIQALGWKPYQNHHEDAHGQFEMNWEYDTAMVTADRHTFFKFMLKSVAEKHGLRATFMPKPFATAIPIGCHAHVSLWRRGENLFLDESGELGLSRGLRRHLRQAQDDGLEYTLRAFVRMGADRDARLLTSLPTASRGVVSR